MQFFYSKFCVQPDAYDLTDLINKKIHPFFCEKIRRHEDTIDPDSPRDYLDYLILDAQENDEIGFIAISWTLLGLYVAGSDTLATTIQWLCLNLTSFPKIQGKGLLNTFNHFVKYQSRIHGPRFSKWGFSVFWFLTGFSGLVREIAIFWSWTDRFRNSLFPFILAHSKNNVTMSLISAFQKMENSLSINVHSFTTKDCQIFQI